MRNITPKSLRCSLGACPAVYAHDDEDLVIIGKRKPSLTAQLALDGKVAADEDVVVIPRAYFKDIQKRVPSKKKKK